MENLAEESLTKNFSHNKVLDFIKEREIKKEDFPIIQKLFTFKRDLVIKLLHNIFNTYKNESGEELEYLANNAEGDSKDLYISMLEFYRKYDWSVCFHLVRVLEIVNNK